MFVQNCVVDPCSQLKPGNGGIEESDEVVTVLPVSCENCGASVGVQDNAEVFHFFGVIPSE